MTTFSDFIKNILIDKFERAKDCFERLKPMKLCDVNGTEVLNITSYNVSIKRLEDVNMDYNTYCLEQFSKNGIVPCYHNSINVTQILNGTNGYKDYFVIPVANLSVVSIWDAYKSSGKKVDGCKIVIQNFNVNDHDVMDFSQFTNIAYSDLYFSNITMNYKPTEAIHAAGHEPEFLACLYDFNTTTLAPENFLFAHQDL